MKLISINFALLDFTFACDNFDLATTVDNANHK